MHTHTHTPRLSALLSISVPPLTRNLKKASGRLVEEIQYICTSILATAIIPVAGIVSHRIRAVDWETSRATETNRHCDRLKVMLHETIRNDDFEHNTTSQHCCDIVSNCYNIVPALQRCVALIIVFANRPVLHHLKRTWFWCARSSSLKFQKLIVPTCAG